METDPAARLGRRPAGVNENLVPSRSVLEGCEEAVAPGRESIQRGRNLFSSQCVWCHGPKGDGKGELALADNLPTPDFTAAQQKKCTDGELFYILTHGHGSMPGQGSRLREKQKWDLINFIRSLAPAAKPKALKPN